MTKSVRPSLKDVTGHKLFRTAELAFVVYVLIISPWVFSTALSATQEVTSTTTITASQLPQVAGLYLTGGGKYHLSILKSPSSNETWAVVSSQSLAVGSLVHVSSSVAEWNVQPYSMSVAGYQGFDMLVIAGSVSVVPQLVANVDLLLQSWGKPLLVVSTLFALANPLYFIGLAWYYARRIPLWLLVAVAWVYAAQFLAADVLGSGYGLYPSFTLLAAVVVLIPAAVVIDKLELTIRERLKSPGPASS